MSFPDDDDASEPLVLIVEDEPIQLIDMVDHVEDAGFSLVHADNTDRALTLFEAHPSIRLLLADIKLPGAVDGLRLATLVRERRPACGLILTTAGRPPAAADLPAEAVFLPKPLDYRRLNATLRRLL